MPATTLTATDTRSALNKPGFSPMDIPSLVGKRIVITGANTGLGLNSAQVFASKGAEVVLACRNIDKGEQALKLVSAHAATSGAPAPQLVSLDLGSLASVAEAAATISQYGALDVLINNAGIMAVPFSRTVDGFEAQIGTNHLGHFALTGLLLPQLLQTQSPRVVTLASIAHRQGIIRTADLNYTDRRYSKMGAYQQSKLANLLFSAELARLSQRAHSSLISVAVHPGVAATNLFDAMVPNVPGLRPAFRLGIKIFGNDSASGALSQMYAATMDDVHNNDYLGPNKLHGMRGPVARSPRTKSAWNEKLAAQLWECSVELTGQHYRELTEKNLPSA
ncbi:MAG: oxidoreductase [Mycobacteriaceae bacterium]